MAKNSIRDFSATASSNTDIQSVDIDENCAASGINNAIRELMADLADVDSGTVALTSPQADNLTVTGTVTTDTIAENTSAAGVTIDGVLLKDGGLGSATAAIAAYLSSINGGQIGGNRNLIINGAVTIDQRNSGSSLTVNANSEFYAVDRFMGIGVSSDGVYTLQRVTDAPDDFTNSIKATVTTADSSIPSSGRYIIRHKLEGNAISQLNLGSSAAKTFTLSFYVKSSLTGTFGGSVLNGAQDRSYPFTYTISSANTWERKTVTIAGDTTGTWPTDSSKAMQIGWSLGVGSDYLNTAGAWVGSQEWGATGETAVIGTLNATWQITGIQLEVGEQATPFEHRSYGDELARCQRYYEKSLVLHYYQLPTSSGAQVQRQHNRYQVQKRAAPTLTQTKDSGSAATTVGNVGGNLDGILHSFGGNNGEVIYFYWTADAEL